MSFTGTNATGFSLSLSQNAIATGAANAVVTVGAINEGYTGTTTSSSGVVDNTGGAINLNGLPGSIVVLGNLTINNSTVTMNTNQGQIAATSVITLNGGSALTLVGTNRFSTTLAFNNSGGTANPTVTVGTLLDLSSTTAINAANDNSGSVNTITGGTLNLSSASGTIINVTGLSLNDLAIASTITTNAVGTATPTGQTITKTGAGSLILPNADANSLTWALTGGSIFVNNATALGTNASAGALSLSGTIGLASDAAGTSIALPTIFTAATNLSLGGQHGNNNITLSGAMNLNGQAPTFTVAAAISSDAITGQITSTGGFTKAGAGILTLSPGTASTFTGPVTVSGGLLVMGNANALGGAGNNGSDLTVGTGAELNMNAFALSIGSLSGGGIITDSSSAQALTIGTGSNVNNNTFSGSLTAATQASLSLIKTGTNNQTLSGTSFYTGVTTVSGGTLTLKNGSTSATTPTLNNTAITVAAGATLAVSAAGSNVGTNNTVNIGDIAGANAGASLTLSPAAGTSATFDMRDGAIGTFKIIQAATNTGLTLGGSTAGQTAVALKFDIGATVGSIDLLQTAGKVVVGTGTTNGGTGGVITINALGSTLAAGNYTFITGAAGSNLGFTNLALASANVNAGGHTYAANLSNSTATSEILTIGALTSTIATAYWGSGAAGAVANTASWNTFSLGNTNWSTIQPSFTEAGALPAFNTNVNFSVTGATNLATTLGEDFTINSLTFLSSNTTATSIAGNTLTINAGTAGSNPLGNGINVQSGAGAATIFSNVVLGAAQTWTNNSSNTLTVSGASVTGASLGLTVAGTGNTVISAPIQTTTGSLTKSGSGVLTLSGADTYTGATSVTAGVLAIASTGSLANTAISVTNASSTLSVLTGQGVTVNLGSTATASAGATLNLGSGAIFNMNDTGIGTASLLQGSTFAGAALTIGGATLNFDLATTASGGADQLAVTKSASVSGTNTIGITTLGSSLTNGATYNLITASTGLTGTFQFSNGGATETVTAGGTTYGLTLTNTATAEKISVADLTNLTWTGRNVDNTANDSNWTTLVSTDVNWANGAVPAPFVNGSAVTFQDLNTVTGSNVTNSTVTVQAAGVSPSSVVFNNSAVNYTVGNAGGVIGIAGTTGITKNGTGTVTLNGANTYSGATTINGGTVQISAANNLGDATQVTNAISLGAATLESTAGAYNLGTNRAITLTGAGTIQSDAGTLTVDGTITNAANLLTVTGAGNTTISGVIGNGAGGLTKTGAGALTLSGTTANTYTGLTTVSAGTLNLNKTGVNAIAGPATAVKNSAANVLVNGGTLNWQASNQVGDNARIDITSGFITFNTFDETIFDLRVSGAGNVDYGSGTVNVTDPVWSGGTNTIHSHDTFGTLSISGGANTVEGANTGGAGLLTIGNATTSGPLDFTGSNNTPALILNSDNATPGAVQFASGLTVALTFTGTGASTGLITSAAGGSIAGRVDLNGSTREFNIANTGAAIGMTISANIMDSTASVTGITKTGTGTLLLNATNAYTGTTAVSAGTLQVGDGTAGSINTSSGVTVASGATLGVNLANTGTKSVPAITTSGTGVTAGTVNANGGNLNTISSAIGGTGNFIQSGAGTTTLSNTNTYAGTTTVLAGTLVVSGSISGTTSVAVGGGAGAANLSVTGSVGASGTPVSGGVNIGANGTLSGNGTIYGAVDATTAGAGTISPTAGTPNGLVIASGSLTMGSNSTLQLSIQNTNGGASGVPTTSGYSLLTLGSGVSAAIGGTLITTEFGTINSGDLFTIILSQTTVAGMFNSSTPATLISGTTYSYTSTGGQQYEINYGYNGAVTSGNPTGNNADAGQFALNTGGNNVALLAIPEPNSFGMLLASLGMALGLQRFRRRRS